MDLESIESNLVEAIGDSVTTLPQPTLNALKDAREKEEGPAKVQLEAMLGSVEIGERDRIPVCQDTGIPTFFIKIGKSFPEINELGRLEEILINVIKKATEEVPLRPNTVHPISGKNPGNNVGEHVPYIDWAFQEGNSIEIYYLPKGGGSENMCQLNMMTPGRGLKGVKEIVLERIATMEGKPCPPTIVGVGLGGGSNISMNLAKEAILRPIGDRHDEDEISELESELKEKANELGVGPMGVGGKTTVLDVHLEYAHRHPASFPVGIVIQCWCNRRTFVTIDSDGSVEVVY